MSYLRVEALPKAQKLEESENLPFLGVSPRELRGGCPRSCARYC
ncbi:MAG: hypothetical protein QXI27_07015 [Nitrososphaerota archaeon]